jgi:hypothetical protein
MEPKNAFEQAVQEASQASFFSEYWNFLNHSKKWWLLPIALILLLFGILLIISGGAAAPFIYTMF